MNKGNLDILLFLIVYLLVGYIIVRLIRKAVVGYGVFWQLTIKSFFYAFIFGVNIIGSGGDPGFALPAPNLISFVFMWDFILAGNYITIEVFVYWWAALLLVMLIRHFFKYRAEKETQILEHT